MKNYDVAAYVWPAYTGEEPRAYQFWPDKCGEWQSVKSAQKKYEGDTWPRKPLWGYVNEADPKVMEMEIEQAVSHGVNVFIYDWYWYDRRPFLEQCLNEGFLKAKNRMEMKFCLMWANHNATTCWDKRIADLSWWCDIWRGDVDRKEFNVVIRRIIDKYFRQPNYYMCDGRPVFMIYDLINLIKGLGGLNETIDALEFFRKEVKSAGFKDLYLVHIITDGEYNLSGIDTNAGAIDYKQMIKEIRFDAVTHYQFAHFTNVNRDYEEIVPDVLAEWKKQKHNLDIPYYPHVSIGWDNNPRFKQFIPNVTKNNTPQKFEYLLQQAREFIDENCLELPLITINSWNEWTETSYLQPDDKNGYGYLDAIKKVFKYD